MADKREGDGATPLGTFPIRYGLFRPDRGPRPDSVLEFSEIQKQDGWCDDPKDKSYNRPVRLPYEASCETLWRDDGIYDVIIVLGHNDSPPRAGHGSAIFFHLARPDYSPTEGCIAVSKDHMLEILKDLTLPADIILTKEDYV